MENQNVKTRKSRLIAWFALSIIILGLGGWLTSLGLGPWYKAMNFPPFQPPGWAFTPAWTVILSLLAIATTDITGSEGYSKPFWMGLALLLYGFQFVLNAGWSLLFFSVQRPDYALVEISILNLVLVGMIFAYSKISKKAALYLVPYLAWLLFATAINWWVVAHNPAFG